MHMRTILCLLFVTSALSTMAQDLDYPDYRSKKDNFSKIPGKSKSLNLSEFLFIIVFISSKAYLLK